MTERIPPRLKSGGDAPPELARALRALGQEHTDAARLERVAGKLGKLLDAPPPSPPLGPWLQRLPHKLPWTELAVAALAVGATLVWLQPPASRLPERSAAADTPSAAAPSTVTPAEVAPAVPSQEQPERVQPQQTPEPQTLLPTAHSRDFARAPEAALRPARSAPAPRLRPSPKAAAVPTREAPNASTHASPTASGDDPSHDREAPQASPLAAPEQAREAPEDAVQPPPPAAPRTEAALLFEARKQLRENPQAALRLLDEHATRFADGMLALEREVLAIETLRKLGQSEQAEQRVRAFRARHPESFHLRSLEATNH